MNSPNSKIYFVRERGFCYNDECYSVEDGFGCVQSSFDDLEAAMQSLKEHTRDAFRGMKIFEFSPLSYVSDKEELQKINDFLTQELNQGFIQPPTNPPYLNIAFDYQLPDSLSVEQSWELRKLTGIEQFELIEGNKDEPVFWGFKLGARSERAGEWMDREASKWNETKTKRIYKNIPIFFNSKEAAFKMLAGQLEDSLFNRAGDLELFQGSFEELSDTPGILKSFMEQNKEAKYNPDTHVFSNLEYLGEKLVVFNSLLKVKLVEVVPFPTQEIIALGTEWDLDYS